LLLRKKKHAGIVSEKDVNDYNGGLEGGIVTSAKGGIPFNTFSNSGDNVKGTKVFTLALDYGFLTCLVISQPPL
jgi:hypothetical protein